MWLFYSFIWIGIPKTHLRRFRHAAWVSSLSEKQRAFFNKVNGLVNICQCVVFLSYVGKHKVDAESSSMQKSGRISP